MIGNLVFVFALVAGAYGGPGQSPHGHELPAEFASRYSNDVLEDARLDVPGLARKYGYPIEEHSILTSDGYILGVHRIPSGKDNQSRSGTRPVVLLMHGLLSSSADFLIMGPGNGLAYILADEGYDVWMGNARGNYYSRKHITLNPDRDSRFWQFSWHEIGFYDVPAMIDYILARTGNNLLHYIGHSQGTTALTVMLATRPEYNANIISAHLLAPVAFMANQRSSLLARISPYADNIQRILSLIGINEFLPNTELMTTIGSLCQDKYPNIQEICGNLLLVVGGDNADQLNQTMIPAILGHTPAGASSRQFVHYAQNIVNGDFLHYNHGLLGNWREYRQFSPPAYPLNRITAPVCGHYSLNDNLADTTDVYNLFSKINSPCGLYLVPQESFSHIDFLWAIDAKSLVYDEVIELMSEYRNNRV